MDGVEVFVVILVEMSVNYYYLLKDGESGGASPCSDSSRQRAFRMTGILWRTMCK